MNILVACEFSGTVASAFRRRGHNAYSCDVIPFEAGITVGNDNKRYHIQGDAIKVIKSRQWDMLIAHPPCTYLANSGVRWLKNNPERFKHMEDGARFFKQILDSYIPKIAVENPVIHKYARAIIGKGHNQTIQPYQFGHLESKRTCLWLKGLPKLQSTSDLKNKVMALPYKERCKIHYQPPSANRGKLRSITYSGIAEAMADQWSI